MNHTTLTVTSPTVVAYFEEVRTNAPKYFVSYSIASTKFKTVIGTPAEPAASNAVVTAYVTITNTANAVTASMANKLKLQK